MDTSFLFDLSSHSDSWFLYWFKRNKFEKIYSKLAKSNTYENTKFAILSFFAFDGYRLMRITGLMTPKNPNNKSNSNFKWCLQVLIRFSSSFTVDLIASFII